jgi:hypothetical protein
VALLDIVRLAGATCVGFAFLIEKSFEGESRHQDARILSLHLLWVCGCVGLCVCGCVCVWVRERERERERMCRTHVNYLVNQSNNQFNPISSS